MIDGNMVYGESDRLILRAWQPADLPLLCAMNRDPEVMKYFPALLTDAESEAMYVRIQEEFGRKGWGLYAVELKRTGAFIGYVGLHEIGFEADFAPGIEISWRLAAAHHRQGYAPEAAKVVLQLAKAVGIERVYAFTAQINSPSERVMQKIGMTKVGEFRHPKLTTDSPLLVHVLYEAELKQKACCGLE